MKKSSISVLTMLLSLMIIPMVSAEILVGQVDSLYNIGDDFSIDITLNAVENVKDFFTSTLMCYKKLDKISDLSPEEILGLIEEESSSTNATNETLNETSTLEEEISTGALYGEVEVYKSPENLKVGEQKVIAISTTLDNFFIGNLVGECYMRARYGSEVADSRVFELTRGVDVEVEVSDFAFDPGQEFTISGEAIKNNKNPLEGFVLVFLEGLNLSVSGVVSSGQFGFAIDIPENAPGGDYDISVSVYEKSDDGEIINEGKAISAIRVNQKFYPIFYST